MIVWRVIKYMLDNHFLQYPLVQFLSFLVSCNDFVQFRVGLRFEIMMIFIGVLSLSSFLNEDILGLFIIWSRAVPVIQNDI